MSIGRSPGIVPKPMTLASPAVLLIIVKSFAPWSRSARIKFCGVPPGPAKPSIISVAPSGISATAASNDAATLFIAIRQAPPSSKYRPPQRGNGASATLAQSAAYYSPLAQALSPAAQRLHHRAAVSIGLTKPLRGIPKTECDSAVKRIVCEASANAGILG